MLSIIIPTLNEERYLPSLLKPILSLHLDEDIEVVISDAGSQDSTVQIAEKHGCKVVSGGLPAKGRNQGAGAASGDTLLFLDPEASVRTGFLTKVISEFRRRGLDVASCQLEPIEEDWMPGFIFPRVLYNIFYNWPALLLENIYPFASSLILVKKDVHEKLGGFDEGIKIAEDHDYARRAARIGKVGFLRSAKLPLFMRRCQKEGIIKTHVKYHLCNLFNSAFGAVRSDIFRYNFGQYKNNISDDESTAEKPRLLIRLLWTGAFYILLTLGFMGWLLFLLLIAPRIIRYQWKKLRSKLFSPLPFKKSNMDLQPQQVELPQS